MSRSTRRHALEALVVEALERDLHTAVPCGDWGTMKFDRFGECSGMPCAELITSFRVRGRDLTAMLEVAKRVSDCRSVQLLSTDLDGSRIALLFGPGLTQIERMDIVAQFRRKFIDNWAAVYDRTPTKNSRPALHLVN